MARSSALIFLCNGGKNRSISLLIVLKSGLMGGEAGIGQCVQRARAEVCKENGTLKASLAVYLHLGIKPHLSPPPGGWAGLL